MNAILRYVYMMDDPAPPVQEAGDAMGTANVTWKSKGRTPTPQEQRFWAMVDTKAHENGCWCWTGMLDNALYGRFRWSHRGSERMRFAHRIAWEITNGPIADNMLVCHKCDNPLCVRPDHMFLGTHADNMRDAKVKNRRVNRGVTKVRHEKAT